MDDKNKKNSYNGGDILKFIGVSVAQESLPKLNQN